MSSLDIWETVRICINQSLTKLLLSSSTPVEIVSIGITNQRETTIIWNKATGKPYHNAIVWNDTRTQKICDKLAEGEIYKYQSITGLPIGKVILLLLFNIVVDVTVVFVTSITAIILLLLLNQKLLTSAQVKFFTSWRQFLVLFLFSL